MRAHSSALRLIGVLLCGVAAAQQMPARHDAAAAPPEAVAWLQTLNAELLAATSATQTLENWCEVHGLADPAVVIAQRVGGIELPVSDAQRKQLQLSAGGVVRHRRVRLTCGSHLLSIADNWYVPARLTPAMNQILETTQTPFGKVVSSLSPHRTTLSVNWLWAPPAADRKGTPPALTGSSGAAGPVTMPEAVFEHHALLYSGANVPIALLHEVYQRGVLEFTESARP